VFQMGTTGTINDFTYRNHDKTWGLRQSKLCLNHMQLADRKGTSRVRAIALIVCNITRSWCAGT
jgi:hypothetical protein